MLEEGRSPPGSRLPEGLLGREGELEALLSEVRAGARLLTVLGPAGIGKTSLATAAAERVASALGARVRACDLSSARSESMLCFAIASLLGAGPGASASAEGVAELLEVREPTLLVLDNFEQLCPCAHVVAAWVRRARALTVLVTSRERLAVDGEHVLELTPLACPPPGASREQVLAADAVKLFLARAREAGATRPHDEHAVAEIVRKVEGIPLAIELAAARTRLFSATDLAERLRRGEDVLAATGKRSSRHRSLSDAIAWSWQLLSAEEQRALSVAAVFKGGFSLDAASALLRADVARRGGPLAAAPLELFAALRDKSLLRLDASGRLAAYHSVAEFAARRLEETGDALEVQLDHARYFADLAERFIAVRLFQSDDPQPALVALVRAERDNLIASSERLASLEGPSPPLLRQRGLVAVALALLYALPPEVAERELELVLSAVGALDARLRALLLIARQTALSALGRYEEALAAGREVIDGPDVDLGLRCFATTYAGIQLRAEGDVELALACHERAKQLLETARFDRLRAMNLACLGRLACDLSQVDRARELNAQATKLCDALRDSFLAGLGLANLAQLEQETQELRRSEELFEQALSRFRAWHEPQYEGIYLARRGDLYLEWGRHDLARESYQAARRVLASLDMPLIEVMLHAAWALLEAESGHAEAASEQLTSARRAARCGAPGVFGLSLELLSTATELVGGSVDAALLEHARRRLRELCESDSSDARTARSNLDTRFALRMLRRCLARHERPVGGRALFVGAEGMWVRVDDGPRVELARRGAPRRLLAALLETHRDSPGRTLDLAALAERGWPGERILIDAAATRVRVAIATLRKLGLRDVLLTRDDGYLLDPECRVVQG